MTAAQVTADIQAAQAIGDTILETLASVDPAVAIPADVATSVLNELGSLISAALTAWSNANGEPITVATLQALLPNPLPLDAPTQ